MTLAVASTHVRAEVHLRGGLLWRPRFRTRRGSWFEPLAVSPWSVREWGPRSDDLPPFLARLGGAFVGLPFGGRPVPHDLQGWSACNGDAAMHGFSANGDWRVEEVAADRVVIAIDGPPDGAIATARQSIRCLPDEPSLEVAVQISARRSAAVPFAYHPILRLPEKRGCLTLTAPFARGYAYPVALAGERIAPGARFQRLDSVPAVGGGTVDVSRLPTASSGEDVLLLTETTGRVTARYEEEEVDFHLSWAAEQLPNLMLWLHENAAVDPPWCGEFRGLGLEPCASAFDFAAAASTGRNPLHDAGERTAIEITPEAPVELTFRMSVEGGE